MKRIGIIGGGLAGISAALKLQRGQKPILIQILEAQPHLGGRVFSKNASFHNKQYIFDMGANLIDFQSNQTQQIWKNHVPHSITERMIEFKGDFLIFQNNKQRKADYYKQRFYYQGGFSKMINDFQSELKNVKILKNTKVTQIRKNPESSQQQLIVEGQSKQIQFHTTYDKIIFACPPPIIYNLLPQDLKMQYSHLQDVIYTRQISVGFVTSEQMQFFSAVLFKNHPTITFICSGQQKYGQNSIVVQTTEQFTNQYFNIEDSSIVINKLWQELPHQFKSCADPNQAVIKKWGISLLKQTNNDKNIWSKGGLKIIGDSIYGKSRITNAVCSGLMIQ